MYVVEQFPARSAGVRERLRPGLDDLAFRAGTAADLDVLEAEAPAHGWRLLVADPPEQVT